MMKKLLEAMTKFAGEPEQTPSGQINDITTKLDNGSKQSFLTQLVSESKAIEKKRIDNVVEESLSEQWDNFNEDDIGVEEKRPQRTGSRADTVGTRGHKEQPRYKTVKDRELTEYKVQVDNFTADDIKELEGIKDLATLKERAFQLVSTPSKRPMKPEKVAWFKQAIDSKTSPMAIIKLMWDLLLSGEGEHVIGSRNSMGANSYRGRFNEGSESESLNIGDDVIITGAVEGRGKTGVVSGLGRDGRFVVVNLYNGGEHSFHSSDVELNAYADSDEEEAYMYDHDPDARNSIDESLFEPSDSQAYKDRQQEKFDAELDSAPKTTVYQLVGRGPDNKANFKFGPEFATQGEAVAYRKKLMANPKTPNPTDIGIRTISKVAESAKLKEGVESADPIEGALLSAIQELISQGHTDVDPMVLTNMVVAATSQPFLLKDLVDANNNSQAVQHYIDSINPNKVKFSTDILTVKNEDPLKDKKQAQAGVSSMAARAAGRNRLGESFDNIVEEGWCVVEDGVMIDGPFASKRDAEDSAVREIKSKGPQSDISVKFGKSTSKGYYIQTRAVNPVTEVKKTDMIGKTCSKCKKGKYAERSQNDDTDSKVACSCGHRVDRRKEEKTVTESTADRTNESTDKLRMLKERYLELQTKLREFNESRGHATVAAKLGDIDNMRNVRIPTPDERREQIRLRKEKEAASKKVTNEVQITRPRTDIVKGTRVDHGLIGPGTVEGIQSLFTLVRADSDNKVYKLTHNSIHPINDTTKPISEADETDLIGGFRKELEDLQASDKSPAEKQAIYSYLIDKFAKQTKEYSQKVKTKVDEYGAYAATGTSTSTAPIPAKPTPAATQAISTIKSATGTTAPTQNIAKALNSASQGTAVNSADMTALAPMMKDVATIAQDPKLANQFKTLATQANKTQQQQK